MLMPKNTVPIFRGGKSWPPRTNPRPKNTICLWYEKDALKAAKFYASVFRDSRVTAIQKAET